MLDTSLAAGSAYAPATFGQAGSLTGGFVAGFVSLLVARQARPAAERARTRDSRREIYDRFKGKPMPGRAAGCGTGD